MKPEKQRIAIAEACGMTNVVPVVIRNVRHQGNDIIVRISSDSGRVPNYPNDLNAMYEAEKVLWKMEPVFLSAYCERLMKSRYPNEWGMAWGYIHATAAQRAEAFLRTIGKWEEAT